MQGVRATYRNGRIELAESVDWPEGTRVAVMPLSPTRAQKHDPQPPMSEWPEGFFDRLRAEWGEEPFERPPQGETEVREEW